MYDSDEKRDFIHAVKECVQFARERKLLLGPGRGAAPASIVLYSLGFGDVDPTQHGLLPERFSKESPDIHIDVEFERGQEFVDFCKEKSSKLTYGKINAFKMPLLNIINNVHKKIGHEIDYNAIHNNSDEVLSGIRSGDIDKIFLLDMSPEALVMKFENYLPEYEGRKGTEKLKQYLTEYSVVDFSDLLNILALWRPHGQPLLDRLERYGLAKKSPNSYGFLAPELREMLKPNSGLIIHQQEIVRIISEYTGWDLDRSNALRLAMFRNRNSYKDIALFRELAPDKVVELVEEENKWAFCKAHNIAFSRFLKQTAVLKNTHHKVYLDEVMRWENKFGYAYDDIGILIDGVSLLQN